MKKSSLILVLMVLFVAKISSQTVQLIADNLVGKEDGVALLNSVDNLLAVYNSKIFYCGANRFADISSEGDYEPWVYDPASNKLSLLKELIPIKGSLPNKFLVSGNKLFFGARDENIITDNLFSSDGTRTGTINVGDSVNQLTGMLRQFSRNTISSLKNGVIFNAYVGLSEFGLWYSDGTRFGTYRINSSGFADNFIYSPKYDQVVFTQDAQIKISDGSITGTKALNDLIVIVAPNTPSIGMGVFGDHFLMEAFDPKAGTFGLFMSNGVSAQYSKLYDYGNLPSMVRNVTDLGNGYCLFSNSKGLWATDGTKNGTVMIPSIVPFKANNAYSDSWTKYKGKLYFSASDNKSIGVELFVTDGTLSGTKLFMDINSGTGDSYPFNFKVHNEILYFSANNGKLGNELWQTDGTVGGTKLVADINLGNGSSDPQYLTGLNNDLYFSASDGLTGHELYRYSGAKVAVDNIRKQISLNLFPTISNGNLFFHSNELASISCIQISDLKGSVMQQIKEFGNKIILDLANGNYLISFYQGNALILTKKIIIQR